MQTTKKIFRISFIFFCLLGVAISFAQAIGKFSCDFEDPTSCKWTQDSSDEFSWTRHQGHTASVDTGPTTDHIKSVAPLANKNQGPGSIQLRGGKCIHVFGSGLNRPEDGESLVAYQGCGESRLEFQLWPNGTLIHTRHGMCVKPVTDGVRVGVFSNCDATDKWSWTAKGSLQYKKKMCLKPETGGSNPGNDVRLVLDSACNELQNFFEFVSASGWYLYIEASSPREPNDAARLISPSKTEAKSCLFFFYYMYGRDMGKLQVYVKSGGNMGLPMWSRSGNHGNKWYQAQVAVNNQTASYQYVIEGVRGKDTKGDIAIDDISLRHSCTAGAIGKVSCDFEDPTSCKWTQDSSDEFDWTRHQGHTPSLYTGPTTDHTEDVASGWYLYIEASSPREPNDAARLISPSKTEAKSCLFFFYYMYGRDMGKLQVYVKSGGKMGLPVWSRSGNHGNNWYQAQVAVNNQTASFQYVIEGVRGKDTKGDIAIDDISLRHSCTAGENQPSKPTSVDNNGSKKVTTTFTVSTTPAILPSQTIYWSEENQPSKPTSVDKNESYVSKTVTTTSTISTTPVVEDKEKTDDSSRIIIIASTVGGVVFLSIVLIVILIKYKRRKRAPKLSTPVNIPLAVATPQKSLPIDQEPGYQTVARVDREFYDDVATNANESEDPSAEGRTSDYEEVGVPSNAHKTSGYETPGQNETYEEPKMSPENPGYTELDKNRLQGRNATDDGTYQKLVKRDSDYVIPAHERRESYEDIRMGRNLPGYTELDLSKREAEDYQKFVKT